MPSLSIADQAEVVFAILDGNSVRLDRTSEMLANFGYGCAKFDTAHALVQHLRMFDVDIALVVEPNPDISLSDFVAALRMDRATSHLPLVVAGPADEGELVAVLTAGADAYLTWPVQPDVLVARVRAMLRRISRSNSRRMNQSHGVYTFYTETGRVSLGGEPVRLTRMEYQAAQLLFKRQSTLVTFADLWLAMWEGAATLEPQKRTVCVHLSRLRTKLKLTGECGYQLISIRGSGYTLVPSVGDMASSMLARAANF
ncbi:response regulator transcription factor [Burkholderia ubonensis]|uniref:response regulator transcription factor n=1 Tax=Burkholderia ubonensis TaxID=101571 RepID=UPI000ADE5BB3|nr:response regulator transcription factor [Burkholderia ubonensis]